MQLHKKYILYNKNRVHRVKNDVVGQKSSNTKNPCFKGTNRKICYALNRIK